MTRAPRKASSQSRRKAVAQTRAHRSHRVTNTITTITHHPSETIAKAPNTNHHSTKQAAPLGTVHVHVTHEPNAHTARVAETIKRKNAAKNTAASQQNVLQRPHRLPHHLQQQQRQLQSQYHHRKSLKLYQVPKLALQLLQFKIQLIKKPSSVDWKKR